jgi:hypothetical protein
VQYFPDEFGYVVDVVVFEFDGVFVVLAED